MILYEVSIKVDMDVLEPYMDWLEDHVQQILKIDGFSKAEVWCDKDKNNEIICHYHLETEKHLEDYINNHAPSLRSDGMKKFEGKFVINRRTARLISRWSR
ncbi:MAG: DUF4286 family protein [Bdellovibrionales bacterium]|jgi:hypothetical protein|nr:DUF4286 family protein [Bdellovibrionales bacterium]